MASDTAGPSDEALIAAHRNTLFFLNRMPKDAPYDLKVRLETEVDAAEMALRARLASNAEALAVERTRATERTKLWLDATARAEAAEAALAECHETLRRLKRTGEMSAAIMRDPRRTGAWEGAERTARAFERMGEFAARALAKEAPRHE